MSIAYNKEIWQNDMVFKDQDDCSKRMLCELNAKMVGGRWLTENERIIATSFGQDNNIDLAAETLEFDLAVVLGKEVMSELYLFCIIMYPFLSRVD